MKTFVINLDRRADRLSFITDQLRDYNWTRFPAIDGHVLTVDEIERQGFKVYDKWQDPLLKRPLTFTEVACAMSHYKLWEKCVELDHPILILEDDVELVGKLDLVGLDILLESVDMVYLDHREMFEHRAKPYNKEYFIPYYPYWNSAYAITPQLAKRLIESEYKNNIIPVDEFFPSVLGVDYFLDYLSFDTKEALHELQVKFKSVMPVKALAYVNKIFKQKSRIELGSDIESGKEVMADTGTKVHLLTVGTDPKKVEQLQDSARRFGFYFKNLGEHKNWLGGDMNGPGGGQKLNMVKDTFLECNDNDIVFFCDGYDVIINDAIEEIMNRFMGFECDVLFAAEINCWPDKSLESQYPKSHTRYHYLNSGVYIGKVGALKKLFDGRINDSDDDQLFLTRKYLDKSHGVNIKLDHENYIFQCLAGAEEVITIKENGQLLNTETKCCFCVLHGNGGEKQKQLLTSIANSLKLKKGMFITDGAIKELGNEFISMDFITPETSQWLIDEAEKSGKWESMYGDKFPGQEIRIREFSMEFWDALEAHFKRHINPQIEKYWFPLLMYGLRDAFIIKYSPGTQDRLNCHHDASLVSGIVRLNDDYEGGDTYFYRQKYSNINIPKGTLLLWPGQVTHGHEGRPVTKGTKYSLVIWTARKQGDINY